MKKVILTVLAAVILCQGAVMATGQATKVSTVLTDSNTNGKVDTVSSVTASGAEYIYVAEYNSDGKMIKLKKQTAGSFAEVTFDEANTVKVIATKGDGITPVAANAVIAPNSTVEPTTPEQLTAIQKAVAALKGAGVDEDKIDTVNWADMFNFATGETPEPTEEPTPEPTEEPTPEPTEEPTPEPTEEPIPEQLTAIQKAKAALKEAGVSEDKIDSVDWAGMFDFATGATPEPTEEPTPEPTEEPTPEPTEEPTPEPTEEPTPEPTEEPTPEPTEEPIPEQLTAIEKAVAALKEAGADEDKVDSVDWSAMFDFATGATPEPTEEPTPEPTEEPTPEPTDGPTAIDKAEADLNAIEGIKVVDKAHWSEMLTNLFS